MLAYGGKSLHEQSHGESFMALFANRFEQGIYILDEPEAALSPQRQLSFLKVIHDLATPGHAQFLIATHSPIILSYPGAVLYDLDGDTIQEVAYRDTKHFLLTTGFPQCPRQVFQAPLQSERRQRRRGCLIVTTHSPSAGVRGNSPSSSPAGPSLARLAAPKQCRRRVYRFATYNRVISETGTAAASRETTVMSSPAPTCPSRLTAT